MGPRETDSYLHLGCPGGGLAMNAVAEPLAGREPVPVDHDGVGLEGKGCAGDGVVRESGGGRGSTVPPCLPRPACEPQAPPGPLQSPRMSGDDECGHGSASASTADADSNPGNRRGHGEAPSMHSARDVVVSLAHSVQGVGVDGKSREAVQVEQSGGGEFAWLGVPHRLTSAARDRSADSFYRYSPVSSHSTCSGSAPSPFAGLTRGNSDFVSATSLLSARHRRSRLSTDSTDSIHLELLPPPSIPAYVPRCVPVSRAPVPLVVLGTW